MIFPLEKKWRFNVRCINTKHVCGREIYVLSLYYAHLHLYAKWEGKTAVGEEKQWNQIMST